MESGEDDDTYASPFLTTSGLVVTLNLTFNLILCKIAEPSMTFRSLRFNVLLSHNWPKSRLWYRRDLDLWPFELKI